MKRFCVIFVFLFFGANTIYAQGFNAKIVSGISASQVDGDNLGGFNKIGFVGGIGVGIPLNEKWTLQAEGFFVQKGSRSSNNDPIYFKWRMSFVEIPFTFRYKFTERFFAEGGLAADILVSSNADGGGGFVSNSENLYRVNPVLAGGVGYKLSEKLAAQIRYGYSLSSISSIQYQYNNTILVYLSINLN
mgnify:CR=1 FL=1